MSWIRTWPFQQLAACILLRASFHAMACCVSSTMLHTSSLIACDVLKWHGSLLGISAKYCARAVGLAGGC